MATLENDIASYSRMIVRGFKSEKLKLDYTLTSFRDIDAFYDLHAKDGQAIAGGRFSKNLGPILFSLGAYIGQTIIKNVPGTVWVLDDKDPEGEINASIQLPNGTIAWPMQRTMKRFSNGAEDGIYVYGYHIVAACVDIEPLLATEAAQRATKPWWKIW